jgi:hypothetical protein
LAIVGNAKTTREFRCEDLYTPDVPVCNLILRVNRHREGLDSRQVKLVELADMLIGVFKPTPRGSKGKVNNYKKRNDDADSGEVYVAGVTRKNQRN